MEDKIKTKGSITITNLTRDVEPITFTNLVTNSGLSLYSDRLVDDNVNFISHIAIGDSAISHTVSSIALNNEIFRKLVDSVSSPGVEAVFNFIINGDEAVGSWEELGLFNAATSGTLSNVVNQTYEHVSGDILSLKWTITHS